MNHLDPGEVHAIIKALHDYYVAHGGHPDLNITILREASEGQTESVTGFVVDFRENAVVLGLEPDNRHQDVPLTEVVRICIER